MPTAQQADDDRSSERPLRAAVVELLGVHDEVVPSVLDMLLGNGVQPTAFLSSRFEARGDVVRRFTGHGDRVHYRPLTAQEEWDALVEEVRGFDLLVLNSYSRPGQAAFVERVGLPAIGVVHNPKLVLSHPACVAGIRSGQVTPVTLAPHVTSWMLAEAPDLFAHTATLGAWMWPMPEAEADPRGRRRIAVPGGVGFNKRDFPLVLDTLPGLVDRVGTDRFQVAVVGGGEDRARLEELVAERGLAEVFDFAPLDAASGAVLSEEYYPRVAGADLLLPLLPERSPAYRVSKITAAVSSSIGFTVPAVIDRWTATVYDLPSLSYPLGGLAGGLTRAITASDDELAAVREQLAERRTTMVERATAEMGEALAFLGSAPSAPLHDRDDDESRPADGATPVPVQRVDRDDPEAFLAFAQLALPQSYAQRLQDLWALWESGFSKDGYFTEFGALNGRDFSNTYLAEQLGWTGVVAEPHPDYERRVRANRRCTVSTKCVFDKTGETVQFHAVQGRPALSTVGGFGTDDARSDFRESFVTHEVETITLEDLLAEAGAPEVVDFLSIDTEGSELVILQAYDFAARPIRLISVEHNDAHRDVLYDFLTAQGYRRKWPDLSGHDDWYVHETAFPDWSADGLPAMLTALQEVPPFKRTLPIRQRLVDELRSSRRTPTEILGVAAPEPRAAANAREASLGLEAAYRFNKKFLRLVARQARVPDEVFHRRAARSFRSLCASLRPTVTLEIGAYEASFSRDMKRRLPEARVVAYEANPHVHRHFRDAVIATGVEYQHKAAGAVSGTAEFRVPMDYRGAQRDPVNQMSSLRANLATDEHELVTVPAVRVDDEFPDVEQQRFVAWIDVEGAAEEVLKGAERVLAHTLAIFIEVETKPLWDGQWLDRDVARFLLERGFVLVGRDVLKPKQFNLVFVHRSVAHRAAVARHAARVYRPVRPRRGAPAPAPSLARRAVGRLSRAARRRTPRG